MTELESLSAFIEMTRAVLLSAGLARCQAGGTVYWSGGSGATTIVLVHGVNDQAGTWGQAARLLAKDYRLIVPDLPGHGESEPKSGPLSMPMMVAALHSVIEKEGAARVTLVGNSMGAWVSILYTLAHPDRVERLVLESGGGLALPTAVPLTASTREEAIRILYAVHGPDAVFADWQPDALIARSKDSQMLRVLQSDIFSHFVDARLKEVKVPTTVVWGANDGVIPRSYIDKVHHGIAGSRLKVIEGAAHIPHAQQPEKFVECLRSTF